VKKETWMVALIALILIVWLGWPKLRAGYASVHTWVGGRKAVITGTAEKGDDSGGVLTNV
jgi:hypothetical protein